MQALRLTGLILRLTGFRLQLLPTQPVARGQKNYSMTADTNDYYVLISLLISTGSGQGRYITYLTGFTSMVEPNRVDNVDFQQFGTACNMKLLIRWAVATAPVS